MRTRLIIKINGLIKIQPATATINKLAKTITQPGAV